MQPVSTALAIPVSPKGIHHGRSPDDKEMDNREVCTFLICRTLIKDDKKMKLDFTSSCMLKVLKGEKMSSKEKSAWVSISVSWLRSV